MTLTEINNYIQSIPQSEIDTQIAYWKTISPTTDEEYYRRFVFALLSVHVGWRANIKSYIRVTSEPEIKNQAHLKDIIKVSGVGLIENRTKGIWDLKEKFFANPAEYKKMDEESWIMFRDRLMKQIYGLGLAKTAFALELCYPNEALVTCVDVHQLRMYECDTKKSPSTTVYRKIEDHWVDSCKARNIPPFIARNIYWNSVQEQKDCCYWTYVFEPKINDISSSADQIKIS